MKNKNRVWGVAALLVLLLTISACSTVPPAQREDRIVQLLAELDTAEPARLLELSATPFLLDGEILAREADVGTMWANLREAGFRFDDASVVTVAAVSADSYVRVEDTRDVRVYFDRYLPEGAGVVEITTVHGSFLVLTGDKVGRIPRIFGFAGPR